jgi:hypothetical protein
MKTKMKSLVLSVMVLSFVFIPFLSFAGPVIIGERVEFLLPRDLRDIRTRPQITMMIYFRVEGGSVNLSNIEYRTSPSGPPPPTIIGTPGPSSGTLTGITGSRVVPLTYYLPLDADGMPYLPARRVCFDIWVHFQDARIYPQCIFSNACLETSMKLTSGGAGRRVGLGMTPMPSGKSITPPVPLKKK